MRHKLSKEKEKSLWENLLATDDKGILGGKNLIPAKLVGEFAENSTGTKSQYGTKDNGKRKGRASGEILPRVDTVEGTKAVNQINGIEKRGTNLLGTNRLNRNGSGDNGHNVDLLEVM